MIGLTTAMIVAAAPGFLAEEVRLMRYPNVSGNQVVFTYASDLWISDLTGGIARRLTSHPGVEYRARFSADGKWVAFSGQYDGGTDVYVMPTEGGEPKRLTYMNNPALVLGWTPSGKISFSSSYGSESTRLSQLWEVDPKGGMPVATGVKEVAEASYSANGSTVAINRHPSAQYNWRRYRGGTQGRIGFFEFGTKKYTEIPQGREQSYFPMWVGQDVYFISDKNQQNLNLYKYNTGTKKVDQLTKFTDGDIKWPSTDGKRIVWERNGRIGVYEINGGKQTTHTPSVISDNVALRARYRSFGDQISGMSISPSGKRVAVEARGDVYSVPASTGITRNLNESQGSREMQPRWSPDGQTIAYLSDASGEVRIYTQPQMGGEAKMVNTPANHVITSFEYSPKGNYFSYLTTDFRLVIFNIATGQAKEVFQDMAGAPQFDWSADESWIAYLETTPNLFNRVKAYNVRTGESTAITDDLYSNGSLSFDLNGKYLYVASSRAYSPSNDAFQGATLFQQNVTRVYAYILRKDIPNPMEEESDEEPVKTGAAEPAGAAPQSGDMTIDFDGINKRYIALPWGAGNYPFVVGVNNGVLTYANGALTRFDFNSKQAVPIISGATGFSFTPNRTRMAYMGLGGVLGIVNVAPGGQVGQGRVDTGNVATIWDPRKEYEQMYWEVWRYERDNFYDPNMLGMNWKAIGDKYAAMLPDVGDRSDLNYLFGMLIGELGTGHAYVNPGETGQTSGGPSTGLLGVDFEVDNGYLKMAKIYRGTPEIPGALGPLGAPGVNVNDGEYLLAVNGKPVTADTNVQSLLVGTVGDRVRLTVGPRPTMTGSRNVEVRPIGNEGTLRYETWVAERRELVNKWSNGRIGYMHIPDTSVGGILGFVRGFYSQSGKEGWIIDERFNGGGSIPTFFIEELQRQFTTALRARHGIDIGFPVQSLDGPKVMLINEHAGSGGDMLPWLFKNSNLGPLIGTRTWGGLVGIQGYNNLVDGGGVSAPSFGIYDTKAGKWIAENTGVDPDIEVDNDPGVLARGDDLQLKAGVDYILGEIAKGNGRKPFSRPDFPRVPANN